MNGAQLLQRVNLLHASHKGKPPLCNPPVPWIATDLLAFALSPENRCEVCAAILERAKADAAEAV